MVGPSPDTPACARAAIRSWWLAVGRPADPGCDALLIEADSGGANGNPVPQREARSARLRRAAQGNRGGLWKIGLPALADELGLTITGSPYPTAAAKWNPMEHRLFSQLSDHWAAPPRVSSETVLKFIRTPKTETGLRGRARRATTADATGLNATGQAKAQIHFKPQRTRPQYHYTIRPRTGLQKK